MNGTLARITILLLGLGLLGGYLWLNQSKARMALGDLELDWSGPASSTWALALDKQVLISRRLPPTGIFDGAGLHLRALAAFLGGQFLVFGLSLIHI